MPDLDNLVADWRRSVAGHFAGREDALDELAAHLHDSAEALAARGLTPDDAVRLALSRMGDADALAGEFAKVPPIATPWLPVRVAWAGGAVLAALVVGPLVPRLRDGGADSLLAGHMALVTTGYLASFLVGFLASCFFVARLFGDLDPGKARTLGRAALGMSGIAVLLTGVGIGLGCCCPFPKSGRWWGLSGGEVGGIAILVWSVLAFLHFAFHRRGAGRVAWMVPGAVGTVVVLLGWRVASAGSLALPAALAAVQIAVACTAFAPAGCLRGRRA